MKQVVVTIKYEEEKLNAIRQYMEKKDVKLESELDDVMDKLYEKYVPQAVREYIESRGDVPNTIRKNGRTDRKSVSRNSADVREQENVEWDE